jgi:hypothetical protein
MISLSKAEESQCDKRVHVEAFVSGRLDYLKHCAKLTRSQNLAHVADISSIENACFLHLIVRTAIRPVGLPDALRQA